MGALLAALSIEQAAMPGILMLIGIIKAHVNATSTFPTEAQILAAVPISQQTLKDLWATWQPGHPVTLPVVQPATPPGSGAGGA